MAEREDRAEDCGRRSRKVPLMPWVQVLALALTVGAVLWRGGQMAEKLDNVVSEVQKLRIELVGEQLGQAALRARVDGLDKEIGNHETRITRTENRRER